MTLSQPPFRAIALTLFPEMFPGPLGQSLAGKALEKGIWSLEALDIRSFATDKHKTVDASPYGGGTGMVLKPDVVDSAVAASKAKLPAARVIYPSPRGVPITQKLVEELKTQDLIFVCGRFEGLDQRVIDHHDMLEVSLGDFILSGGEIAALALLDAIVRLLPGVIGKESATHEESFSTLSKYAGLLEYPHYTRPPIWNGLAVPDILLSGNHEEINRWRLEQAKEITTARRPDLMKKEG
ncbi:MAG: tRNA (guanosine(37)-N1)-methyltransferase TrmD [Rickettsiales bacterium]|nr:tRNA (guanosine(37)-N1)-methyltransferase TrmD [Rickettsiales bacterium]